MSLGDAANHKANEAFDHIPVIDLGAAKSSDSDQVKLLASHIREACVSAGFFYVKNHGIPKEVIDKALSVASRFFSLPSEAKEKLDMAKSKNFKGYHNVLSSNNDPMNRGDLHEGFEFGWEELIPKVDDKKRQNDGAMAGANVWPSEEEVPYFRESLLTYYHAAVGLGQLLFPLLAIAMDLPKDFFSDKTRNSAALMKVLHYPPQTGDVDDRVIGIGAHTDGPDVIIKCSPAPSQCFTILWQQPGIQALQVLNPEHQWIDAPPIEGTLVVNLGDQLARWTNDVFKSTIHRAINRSGVERYSIPLFFGVDYNVPLEPVPSCVSKERPSKYNTILAGDYIKSKFEETYGYSTK
ncbi:2OG-Fe(II) oxygenase [Punctularia strigosozonata HHB-11173 SS5]|uniref:2OG-Fe(II) oxygenase n=1 Tax=Punctularia strigosozonata (strain HHB-11173) TaxID=741275 RepID=UPI0004417763|nr:2OG-Fe(II) oxygenase [Punctularia strigosozonata HHB-11173 SS5]EIN12177.1 2OG-Fe(II) oxygenase [Punctularia strigosozonata HHB-11173 SS5]